MKQHVSLWQNNMFLSNKTTFLSNETMCNFSLMKQMAADDQLLIFSIIKYSIYNIIQCYTKIILIWYSFVLLTNFCRPVQKISYSVDFEVLFCISQGDMCRLHQSSLQSPHSWSCWQNWCSRTGKQNGEYSIYIDIYMVYNLVYLHDVWIAKIIHSIISTGGVYG